VPFAGAGNLEMAWQNLAAAQLQVQFNPTTNNNILLRVAAGQNAEKIKDILSHRTMLGGTLSYYYTTMLGPMGGSIGYSNVTKKFYYYINLGFVF
jgi:NTE family protein